MADKKLKQPVKSGVAKVPVVMQLEALECGAASLTMVLAYYGKWVPLEVVRSDCGVSRDGSNMKNLYYAAQHYGLEVHGYRWEVDNLKKKATFPCIIHWNFNHFVVLDGFKGNKAVLNDPARGVVQVPMEQFDESFTGLVLTFAPGEAFEPSGKRKSTVEFAKKRLKGAGPAVAFIVMTSVISYLFGIINPVMSRVFYDRLLSGQAPGWLYPFIGVLSILTAFEIIVQWAQAIYSLKISGKMAIEGNASYMWKVLRLPMEFFSQRMTGDILQRQSTNASIASTLVQTVAPLALNTIMMVFYLVIMLNYSALMTLVGIASLALNLLVARWLSNKRINLMRVQMRDSGKLASTQMAGISMAETIKASGAEAGFYGLKDAHHISDFETFLLSTFLAEDLAGPSVEKADNAVGTITNYYLDDGHSIFLSHSSLLEADTENAFATGFSGTKSNALALQLSALRQEYPEATAPYYEVGNTAFVKMDTFDFDYNTDYYAAAETGNLPDPAGDTVSLLYQAHQMITRENSPIENVVLDLSMNIGGAAPAAVYTLAWFLGEAQFSTYNTFFGAETTSVYKADLNLDHVYDEKDTISNLNLFCLISPMSFSCGNLVPWAFKEDGRVTLLGRVSGGGSCAVFPMTTAWGTSFRLSGCDRISFVKNGAYYDVDGGVEPDYIIRSYKHFYDRQALTDYINQLF